MKKFYPQPPALFLIYLYVTHTRTHTPILPRGFCMVIASSVTKFIILFFVFCQQISQFLDSQGFLDYLERGLGSDENNNNLLDKLQDAIGRGQNPLSVLPSLMAEAEIITISDPGVGISGIFSYYRVVAESCLMDI